MGTDRTDVTQTKSIYIHIYIGTIGSTNHPQIASTLLEKLLHAKGWIDGQIAGLLAHITHKHAHTHTTTHVFFHRTCSMCIVGSIYSPPAPCCAESCRTSPRSQARGQFQRCQCCMWSRPPGEKQSPSTSATYIMNHNDLQSDAGVIF